MSFHEAPSRTRRRVWVPRQGSTPVADQLYVCDACQRPQLRGGDGEPCPLPGCEGRLVELEVVEVATVHELQAARALADEIAAAASGP